MRNVDKGLYLHLKGRDEVARDIFLLVAIQFVNVFLSWILAILPGFLLLTCFKSFILYPVPQRDHFPGLSFGNFSLMFSC